MRCSSIGQARAAAQAAPGSRGATGPARTPGFSRVRFTDAKNVIDDRRAGVDVGHRARSRCRCLRLRIGSMPSSLVLRSVTQSERFFRRGEETPAIQAHQEANQAEDSGKAKVPDWDYRKISCVAITQKRIGQWAGWRRLDCHLPFLHSLPAARFWLSAWRG